jgi:hypothetical protein
MTTEEIESRIKNIRDIADDAESAHSSEDSLHLDFIKYVATLSEHLPELAAKAKLVASTEDINFSRWYS